MLYLLLRKNGNTLERESVCSFCCINSEVFDSVIGKVEDAFPQYRSFEDALLQIGYRDTKEMIEEKKKKRDCLWEVLWLVEKSKEIRFKVIDNKADDILQPEEKEKDEKYREWRESVLKKPSVEKKKSCKQVAISSLFKKKTYNCLLLCSTEIAI